MTNVSYHTGMAGRLICPNCGYDLRASEGGVCPECGEGFDRFSLAKAWGLRKSPTGVEGGVLFIGPIFLVASHVLIEVLDFCGVHVPGWYATFVFGSWFAIVLATSVVIGCRVGRRCARLPRLHGHTAKSVVLSVFIVGVFVFFQLVFSIVFGCTSMVIIDL